MSGLLDRLKSGAGLLFSGPDDPQLSASDNSMAKRFGLMRAGVGMMGAPTGTPTGQAFAQGLSFGQESGMGMRQNQIASYQAQQEQQKKLQDEQMRAWLAENITDPSDPQQYGPLIRYMASQGDPQRINALTGWINASKRDPEKKHDIRQLQDGSLWDVEDPTSPVMIVPGMERPKSRPIDIRGQNPATGKDEMYHYDENNEVVWTGIAPTKSTSGSGGGGYGGAGSEGERKAAAFAGFIPDHVTFIDQFEGAPGRMEQALSGKGIREFTSDEQQQLQLAGSALAEAWLRMTTGAAYNEREFQTAYQMFVPQPGDKGGSLQMKRQNRQRLMRMLQTSAGRLQTSFEPMSAPTAAPTPRQEPPAASETWQERVRRLRGGG